MCYVDISSGLAIFMQTFKFKLCFIPVNFRIVLNFSMFSFGSRVSKPGPENAEKKTNLSSSLMDKLSSGYDPSSRTLVITFLCLIKTILLKTNKNKEFFQLVQHER